MFQDKNSASDGVPGYSRYCDILGLRLCGQGAVELRKYWREPKLASDPLQEKGWNDRITTGAD